MPRKYKKRLRRKRVGFAQRKSRRGYGVRQGLSRALINRATQNTVYHFKRMCASPINSSFIFTGTAGNTGVAVSFQLNDVPSVTDFTNLFDSYRIDRVVMTFTPIGITNLVNTTGAGGPTNIPLVYMFTDPDDATAPTSDLVAQQYQNCRIRHPLKPFKMSFIPRPQTVVYYNGITIGYATPVNKNPWLDISNPSVPHYAFKMWVNAFTFPNSETCGWNVNYTYYFSCKGVR